MARLTQAALERRVQVLLTNGRGAEAQALLAPVGYDPPALDVGAARLDAAHAAQAHKQLCLARQKEATRAAALARRAAERAVTSLSTTARTLFAADEPTLTALGLNTRYRYTVGPEGQVARRAVRSPRAFAEAQARWRQLVTNAARLEGEAAAQLSAAGWPPARLAETTARIEACAAADTAQQAAVQAYRQAAAQLKTDVAALRAWYRRAARLIQVAIQDNDPSDPAQWRERLGLRM